MEDWIGLLTLDSQTSSQIVSKEFLREIAGDLKEANPLSKDNFETLTNALSDRLTNFESNGVPVEFYEVLRCLCDHLLRRDDVVPLDIRNFFLNFVEVLLKASPDSLVPIYERILDVIHAKIIDVNFSVYRKHAILSSLNEITVMSSAKKVVLFLKPKVFTIYTLLASNLRAIGDYDTQTQLLEFLLHVIPSARRQFFVEKYIHPDLVDPFCAIIGQHFTTAARKFLNLLNPMDPITQSVFSIPCIGIQLCGYELQCQSAVASPSDGGSFWVDFNLVPQRITTYCILAAQAAQLSFASEDPNEQIWETISIYPEVIKEVNVSSILTEDDRGTQVERINLSIITSESPSDYARFWEIDSSSHHSPKENFVTIEFCLAPSDVISNVPTEASEIPVTKDSEGPSQSQEQQLTDLLTGLRAYAEQVLASSSSRSFFKNSQDSSQQRRTPLKSKNIFASCKSPLPVNVGKGSNSQNTTPLPPPPPKPKSFFTDPDISFEESAEGLGLHIPKSSEKPVPRPKSKLKQTVQTPLSVHTSTEEGSGARRRSSGAPSSRSVSSPFSVVSGLETPTPIRSCKTLEGPNLGTIDLTSSDDDIASVSHNKLSAEEHLAEEIEEDETPPKMIIPRSQLSTTENKQGSKEPGSTPNMPSTAVSQKQIGSSQSENETSTPQPSISKTVDRGRSKTAPAVKTTPIIIERSGQLNTLKKQTPLSTSTIERVKKHIRMKSPAASSNQTPLNEVIPRKSDIYDFEEISEIQESAPKHPGLETFEKFVEENKLEMLSRNQRHRLRMEDPNEGVGLVEEITNVLGKEATRPLTRGRGRGEKSTKIAKKTKVTKINDNDEAITEVPSSLLKPTATKELECVTKNYERPTHRTRSGKRFSQSPVNVEEEDSSKKVKGKPSASKGKGRGSLANRKGKKVEVPVVNKDKQKEASQSEVLAGSSDIIRSMRLSQEETPTPTPTQAEINPSQEDLLADLSPIHAPDDVQAVSSSQERQNRVVNQCPSARSTRALLESAHSLQAGPEKIDASGLISEVSPSQTPKRAVAAPLILLQDLRATPERARSGSASPDMRRVLFSIPKIPPSIIEEEESILKSEENDNDRKKIAENLFETPKEVVLKKSKGEKRPIFGNISHLQPVDLDDMEVTPIGKTKTNAPIDKEADIFASPIQPAPRSAVRSSTTRTSQSGVYNSTTTRTTSFSSRDSQSLSRSKVSPLFMSPLIRLEAAVNALESTEEKTKNLTSTQANFCSLRQLYDPNVSYLLDQSPSVLSQERQTKTPPPGGLIVPAFGNKYYSITSKSALLARTEDGDTKANESALQNQSPKATKKTTTGSIRANNKGDGRRFFTSTFAERNKREVERHFFEIIGEPSDPSTPRTGGSKLKSGKKSNGAGAAKRLVKRQREPKQQTKKAKSKAKLSYLEGTPDADSSDANFDPRSLKNDASLLNESSHKLRSRSATRQAAKIAKSKILETSLLENFEIPRPSPLTFAKSPRGKQTTTPSSIERPRRDLNASQTSLFYPTPNNTAIFDFTLSEDDELVSGLPRFGKETPTTKEKSMKNPCIEDIEIVDLDDSEESDFKSRINQLKDQVDEMHRLLKRSQRGQAEGRKI